MTLAPMLRLMAALVPPDATVTVFTFTVALACATVGETVTDVVALETVDV